MSDLISRLKSWHHLAQGDGLEALIVTGIEAADRITALEAQVAAADRLADAMPGLMDFIERHSNRWDGIIGKHPMEIHMDAIAALAAYHATKEPKA